MHNYEDADINVIVQRLIAASAIGGRAVGEQSSKRTMLNALDSATASGQCRGSDSIAFNISHCLNV